MDMEKRQQYEKMINGIIKGEDVSGLLDNIIQGCEQQVLKPHNLSPHFRSYVATEVAQDRDVSSVH